MHRTARGLVRRALSSRQRDPLLEVHQQLASVLNKTAHALGVRHRLRVVDVEEEEKKGPAFEATPGRRPPRLQSALRYMTQEEIEAYAERLVGSGQLGDFEGLPRQRAARVERFVYSHCVKILLCLMHEALDRLEVAEVFGLRVSLTQTARAKVDLLGSLERRLLEGNEGIRVDVRSISSFVDRVVEIERSTFGTYPSLERALLKNVSNIVLNLLADACSTYRLDFFGHSLRLALEPNDALDHLTLEKLEAHRDFGPPVFDDRLIDALVDEILSDKDINLWLIPDALERSFYRRFFLFYGVLLDYALSDVHLNLLDVHARLRFERSSSSSS